MATLQNTCEGSVGLTVTSSNNAGPNQFTSVQRSGITTVVYRSSPAPAHGATSVEIFTGPAGDPGYVSWGLTSGTTFFARTYLYLLGVTSNARVMTFVGSSAARGYIQVTPGRQIRTVNAAGSVVATMASVVPLNTWVRVDLDFVGGTSGNLTCRYYAALESATATETLNNSTNTGGAADQLWFGPSSSGDSVSISMYLDDVGVSDTAALPPINPGTEVAAVAATATAGTGTPVVTGVANFLRTSASAKGGNSASPFVTLPGSILSGDAVVVQMTVNNVESVTAHPAALAGKELGTGTAQGQIAGHIYAFIASGATAGSVLTWTLSTTRQYSIVVISYAAVDQTTPVHQWNATAADTTTSTSITTPAITTTLAGCTLAEVVMAKANGVTITTITAPAGWTAHATQPSNSTFAPAAVVGSLNANPIAPGSWGAQTWTADQAAAGKLAYTLALAPAPKPATVVGVAATCTAAAGVPTTSAASGATATAPAASCTAASVAPVVTAGAVAAGAVSAVVAAAVAPVVAGAAGVVGVAANSAAAAAPPGVVGSAAVAGVCGVAVAVALAPSPAASTAVTALVATATATAGVPVVAGGATITSPEAAADGAAIAPTLVAGVAVTAVPAAAVAAAAVPAFTLAASVVAVAGVAAAVAPAPTVGLSASVASPAATAAAAAGVPSTLTGTGIVAPAATATAAAAAPSTVTSGQVVAVRAAASALARPPVVQSSGTVAGASGTATADAPAPTVQAGARIVAVRATASAVFIGPTGQGNALVTATAGSAVAAGRAPAVSLPNTVQALVAVAVAAALSPAAHVFALLSITAVSGPTVEPLPSAVGVPAGPGVTGPGQAVVVVSTAQVHVNPDGPAAALSEIAGPHVHADLDGPAIAVPTATTPEV